MDLGIEGRHALVMGGSRGLGRAIAEALIAEGVQVAICARNPARVQSTASEIRATGLVGDLSTPGAAADIVREVIRRFGALDILVTNTGGPSPRPFEEIEDDEWRSAFETLWMSSVTAIRASLPAMRARGWGRVVLVTSIAAREPIPNLMPSNSLRAGLHGLVNSLSKEVARYNVTVNALMPGYTLTDRVVELGIDEAEIVKRIPARRMGTPAEFGAAAAFLASTQAAYITGQAIACDGGFLQSI
jgi:3-oxoacyl-[acyl-carrier protein] reductase